MVHNTTETALSQAPGTFQVTAEAPFSHPEQLQYKRGKLPERDSTSLGHRAARAAGLRPSSSSSSSSPSPALNTDATREREIRDQNSGMRQGTARMLRGPLRHERSPQKAQAPPPVHDEAPQQGDSLEVLEAPRPLPGFLRETASQTASQAVSRTAGAPSAQPISNAGYLPYSEPAATQRALLLAQSIARSPPSAKPAPGSPWQPREGPWQRPGATPGAVSAPMQQGSRMAIDASARRSGLTSNGVPISIAEKYSCRYRAEEADVHTPRTSRRVPKPL